MMPLIQGTFGHILFHRPILNQSDWVMCKLLKTARVDLTVCYSKIKYTPPVSNRCPVPSNSGGYNPVNCFLLADDSCWLLKNSLRDQLESHLSQVWSELFKTFMLEEEQTYRMWLSDFWRFSIKDESISSCMKNVSKEGCWWCIYTTKALFYKIHLS